MKDLNKEKDITQSWIRKLNVKMAMFSKLIYTLNAILSIYHLPFFKKTTTNGP